MPDLAGPKKKAPRTKKGDIAALDQPLSGTTNHNLLRCL